MRGLHHSLPLARSVIADVPEDLGLLAKFDQPEGSALRLDGPFIVLTGDVRDEFAPPFAAWVRDILLSMVGVPIRLAKYGRTGVLRVVFEDGRELQVPDGPFENWHFESPSLQVHGGVGRAAEFNS